MRLPPFTLRLRLILLVALAVLPAFALILYTASEERSKAEDSARVDAVRLAELGAADANQVISRADQLLLTLAQMPAIQDPGDPECGALLGRLLIQSEPYAALVVARPNGDVACAAPAAMAGASLAGTEAFNRALNQRRFTMSGYEISPATGRTVVTFFRPVITPGGDLTTVVAASIDLHWLNAIATTSPGPGAEGSSFVVVDEAGRIISRAPDVERLLGTLVAPSRLREAVLGQLPAGTFREKDVTGTERLFGFLPIGPEPGRQAYVFVGLPTDLIFADANTTLQRNLAGLAVATALALAVAWLIGDRFFLRRVRALVSGTRRVAAGELTTPIPLTGRDELGLLARSFNDMTAEVALSRDQLEQSEAQFRSIFQASKDGLAINDPETGSLVEANPAFCAMHGYTRDEMIGMHPSRFVDAPDQHLFAEYVNVVLAGGTFRSRAVDVRKDGSRFNVEILGTAFVFNGRTHVLAVLRDVTEQVHAYELLEERVAERTRELTTLLDVSQTVVSTIEFGPLLDAVLEELGKVVPYARATISAREGEDFRVIAARGDARGSFLDELLPGAALLAQLRADPAPVIIDDTRGDTPFAAQYRRAVGDRLTTDFAHVRSWMAVPIFIRQEVGGVFQLAWPEPGRFDRRQADLAMAFANHASAALENARLFAESQRRLRENATLAAIAASFTVEQPLEATLDAVAHAIGEGAEARACSVAVIDPVTRAHRHAGGWGLPEGYIRTLHTLPRSFQTLATDQLGTGEIVLLRGARQRLCEDERYRSVRSYLAEATWDSIVVLPLLFHGQPIGAVNLGFPASYELGEENHRFFAAIAAQAAVALENARLFETAERGGRENAALAAIAASFTLDEALGHTMNELAARITATTHAVAAAVMLIEDGQIRASGQRGLPGDYVSIAAQSLSAGAPSALMEAAGAQRTVLRPDARARMLANPLWSPLHERLREAAWEGIVATPLVYHGQPIGAINTYYLSGEMPSPQEVAFLEAIAAQAAVGLANVRLFAQMERRLGELEALTRVAAGLTVVQPVDSTLRTLADTALEATGAVACVVLLFDVETEALRFAVDRGLPEGYVAVMEEAWRAGHRPQIVRSFLSGRPFVVRDVRRRLLERPEFGALHRFVEEAAWDSVGSVPLSFEGRAVGALGCYFLPGERPDQRDMDFLAAIADQASVAVENARLFTETADRTRELDALYRADAALHRSLRVDDVLQALVDVGVELMGAHASAVVLWEPGAAQPHMYADRGVDEASRERVVESVSRKGRADWEQDAPIEPWVTEVSDTATGPRAVVDLSLHLGVRSLVEVPIIIGGRLFGVLSAGWREPGGFGADAGRVFTTLARRAAIAIENAQLYERAQQFAAVEERQRLARELHDSVSQALYGIALGARTARTLLDRDPTRATEPVDYVLQLAEAGLAEMRALIFELRPESIESEGLVAALEKQVNATRARYGVEVDAALAPEPDAPLAQKEAVYRIAQEALHNVVKHARASHVWLAFAVEDEALSLEVRDDGVGFAADGDFPGHLGLRSMRERATRLGGTLVVASKPGQGSTVRARIPILAGAPPSPVRPV